MIGDIELIDDHVHAVRLPTIKRSWNYYKNYDFERLAKKMIFGTDWPGVPGPRHR